MAGSAGWLVDWIMIEHTACQPPWLANWLTNWLPAWLNDDLTRNLPLFQPFLIIPTTQWQPASAGCYLHGNIIKWTNKMTIEPSCNASLADRSLLRHWGRCSHKEINILQWLSSTWHIGCKGLAKFTKEWRQYMTFVERQQLSEWVRRSWRTGGILAGASIKHECSMPTERELQHILSHWRLNVPLSHSYF